MLILRSRRQVAGLHAAGATGSAKLLAHVHRLERHMRERQLASTLTERLDAAPSDSADEVTSKREARRLAAGLFWNVCRSFDRQVFYCCLSMHVFTRMH